MDLPWLPALLQTGDALFPTGAYAHSLGVEEAVRLELVRDEVTLLAFLRRHLLPAQQTLELPYLRWCWEAAQRGDLEALAKLDHEISAWKLVEEIRSASLRLGARRLKSLQAICDHPLLAAYAEHLRQGVPGHHLAIFGLQSAALAIPLEPTLTAWLYQTLAAVCSAALKLLRVGQDACQRALRAAASQAPAILAASLQVEPNCAGSFNPLLEIAAMRHAFAEERLFIS